MSRLKSRVEKIEGAKRAATAESIIYINRFAKSNHENLPGPETEIAGQRTKGRRFIVVGVPTENGGEESRA